jgi:Bacterial PH domain
VIAPVGNFEELTLPKGERLLWQGRPKALGVAVRVFHMRPIAVYFVLLFIGRVAVADSGSEHEPLIDAITNASSVLVPFAVAMLLLGGLALLYSRTTRYSLTNRRLLLQFGAVLPMTLNVPFSQVASAAMREYRDGSGDLPLSVTTDQRLAFLLLWPHVRPWRLTRVEPMLRCVPQARDVADILAKALEAASAPTPEPVATAMPVPRLVRQTPATASAA